MNFLNRLTVALTVLLWAMAIGILTGVIFTPEARAAYPCVPKEIGGSGTYYRLTAGANAYALQWVCTDAAGKGSIYGPVWRKAFVPSAGCATRWSRPRRSRRGSWAWPTRWPRWSTAPWSRPTRRPARGAAATARSW